MAKVITFSRTFPAYHPQKGQPTLFVESIISGEKKHTIRAGHRWSVGDKFSPRVWSGKPYNSPQIIIAPDMEIKKVWNIEIFNELGCIYIGVRQNKNTFLLLPFGDVAKNDGLTFQEMLWWFNVKPDKLFTGQIICWNENVNY